MKTKNKKTIFFFFLFLFISIFVLGKNTLADNNFDGLIISEIMYNPAESNSDHSKWVELFNSSSEKITLNVTGNEAASGWKIDELKLTDSTNHYFYNQENIPIEIDPGEFFIITDNVNNFVKDYPDLNDTLILKSAISLTSSKDIWKLSLYQDSRLLDEISYGKNWGADDNGMSLEKIDIFGNNEQVNWRESCIGGTPGRENSTEDDCPESEPDPGDEEDGDEAEIKDDDEFESGEYNIRLNEVLPNPKGDEKKEEYIEIYNGESFAINLKDWILKDSSKKGKFVFAEDYEIKPGEYLTIYRDIFKFSLNNSGKESIYFMDPDGNIASNVTYENAKEDISYNFNGLAWNWSKHLTPGKENKFNSVPKVKIKKIKSGHVGVPVYFEVDVKSKDKDELKYSWDFDDGSRSYLQNVNHTFKKKGTYKIKLAVDDGGSGVEKDFKIKIKKYPKTAIEITRLLPNPKGNDTGEEWLEVKNNSSKEVNLKGWKIATGQKNLTNHTITDDLKIPAGAVFQITRENALFFLNNKETKIELRYPDGKTAAKASYKKDKIEEGEICRNKGGVCEWIFPKEDDGQEELENEEEEEINIQKEDGEIFESELSKINFSEEFLRENMGKLSKEEKKYLLEKIYKIRLVENNSDDGLVIDLSDGKNIVYQEDGNYRFNRTISQTHWAVELIDDVKVRILLNMN